MPLSWQEMAHWASLTSAKPRSDEWRVLRAMDNAFLSALRDKDALGIPETATSGRLLTPELFDAIF